MKAIWKYQVQHRRTELEMPKGAQIIRVAYQPGRGSVCPTLWALVSIGAEMETRVFHVHGTGDQFDAANLKYLGSSDDGVFVYHVFEEARI